VSGMNSLPALQFSEEKCVEQLVYYRTIPKLTGHLKLLFTIIVMLR